THPHQPAGRHDLGLPGELGDTGEQPAHHVVLPDLVGHRVFGARRQTGQRGYQHVPSSAMCSSVPWSAGATQTQRSPGIGASTAPPRGSPSPTSFASSDLSSSAFSTAFPLSDSWTFSASQGYAH